MKPLNGPLWFRAMGLVLLGAGLAATVACRADRSRGPDAVAVRASDPRPQAAVGAAPGLELERAIEAPGIHNAVAFHDGVISGSEPDGEAGLDTLRAWGVRTIISVDGAAPDVTGARARGMRYVHLPIGYDGFDDTRRLELARATRDAMAEGPVYIHCHHGRHRSAGAAACVAVSLGWMDAERAVSRMRVSGTSESYPGLYALPRGATLLTGAELDAISGDFPEVSRPSGFVQGMVEIDRVFEHLDEIEEAGWVAPENHPDLVPASEAGRLADLYRALIETEIAEREGPAFIGALRRAAAEAGHLETLLVQGGVDSARLSAAMSVVADSCISCHRAYRN